MNYYNEFDPYAAEWLRNLIKAGSIPAGDVDDRSIVDVRPADLAGYDQCHFFAGIGGWALALRLAGYPTNRQIWTGSCPCQPFSNAGKGAGTDDPRHLWPDFFRLIRAGRPAVVMGEQVAGSAGYGWFDGVQSDLAGEDYASRAVDIPACAVDAPHIRNRLYWLAVANDGGRRTRAGRPHEGAGARTHGDTGQAPGSYGGGDVADAPTPGRGRWELLRPTEGGGSDCERSSGEPSGSDGRIDVADTSGGGLSGWPVKPARNDVHWTTAGWDQGAGGPAGGDASELADPLCEGSYAAVCGGICGGQEGLGPRDVEPERLHGVHGVKSFWAGADWINCHDGKARRTKPGLPMLVDGIRGRVALGSALGTSEPSLSAAQAEQVISRVGVWKGAGNAIVPQEAEQVIRAFMEVGA